MATYAIGDVQGCYEPLRRLLELVGFDPAADRLWFTGDLVNRGPDSLSVVRFVKGLGAAGVAVLGNHDLHLISRAEGVSGPKRQDTLDGILAAADRDEIIDWLRRLPLIHCEDGYVLCHAGLLPQWSTRKAVELAREVESRLRAADYGKFLRRQTGRSVEVWSDGLQGPERWSGIIGVFTRLRCCTADGRMALSFSGAPADAPAGYSPWYVWREPGTDETVLYGHWAALGFHRENGAVCLDSGCVWGGPLTALRLDDGQVFQAPGLMEPPHRQEQRGRA